MTALTGTWTLARLALRRDRILLSVWVVLVVGVVAGTAASIADLFPTAADREAYATGVAASPAAATYGGPGFGLPALGGIFVFESTITVIALVALPSMWLTVRYTRAEEETGRAELTGSAVLGRHARLASALLVVGALNAAMAVLAGAALIEVGLPADGSVAFALGMAGMGWVFAAVAAVAAQFVEHARSATGLGGIVLGAAFLLRAVGDASHAADAGSGLSSLSWLSPIGWAQQVRAFGDERWWIVGLLAAATAALVGVAVALRGRRDLAAGLVPARAGRPEARPGLASAWALTWRLQRGSMLGWTVGFALTGAAIGALGDTMTNLVADNADLAAFIGDGGSLADALLAAMLDLIGLVASAYAVAAVLRMRAEESDLRAEPLLATAVSRGQWAVSHVAAAIAGSAVLMVSAGVTMGLVYGLQAGDVGGELPRVLGGALVQLPAVWVVAAVAVALFGLLPGLTVAGAWLAVAVSLLLGQLGDLFQLDQWVLNVSPFTHLPQLPGDGFTATPVLWLVAVAVALGGIGLVTFRRRDIG